MWELYANAMTLYTIFLVVHFSAPGNAILKSLTVIKMQGNLRLV